MALLRRFLSGVTKPDMSKTEKSPVPERWNDGPIRYEQETEDDMSCDPELPTIDHQPPRVEYEVTPPPTSFIISGPLGPKSPLLGDRPDRGRRFDTIEDALTWASLKYPSCSFKPLDQDKEYPRWAIRVYPTM